TTMLDGYESPIQLKVRMTIGSGDITVDYAGSSGASERGINSPKCYTDAYSVFGLKFIVAPAIPNNAGSLEPFHVLAEEHSWVHPLRPAPVKERRVIWRVF